MFTTCACFRIKIHADCSFKAFTAIPKAARKMRILGKMKVRDASVIPKREVTPSANVIFSTESHKKRMKQAAHQGQPAHWRFLISI